MVTLSQLIEIENKTFKMLHKSMIGELNTHFNRERAVIHAQNFLDNELSMLFASELLIKPDSLNPIVYISSFDSVGISVKIDWFQQVKVENIPD